MTSQSMPGCVSWVLGIAGCSAASGEAPSSQIIRDRSGPRIPRCISSRLDVEPEPKGHMGLGSRSLCTLDILDCQSIGGPPPSSVLDDLGPTPGDISSEGSPSGNSTHLELVSEDLTRHARSMRSLFRWSRVQTAEPSIRAADEESAPRSSCS
jgi:hypothetical protein